MEQDDKISGIYKIININTGKVYIGSSNDIERRHKEHLRMLNENKHHSYKLQQSFNRTKDKDIFQFEIIEEVDQRNLKEREQYYIDFYDAFNNGYNCSAKVDNPKYTYKHEQAKEKGRIKEERYQEFIKLINQYNDKLKFKNVFKTRLLDRHYSSSVYLNINNMIKWFLENYNIDDYNARFDVRNNRQYHLLISDKNGNEFVCYKYDEGQIFNSLCDTKALINKLGKKGIYRKRIHYIVKVPDFN